MKKRLILLTLFLYLFSINNTKKDIKLSNPDIVYADSIKNKDTNKYNTLYQEAVRGVVGFNSYVYVTDGTTKALAVGSFGSGFFYKEDYNNYYLMTNAHVVKNANKITIVTYGNQEVEVNLIGYDEIQDVAVCKVLKNKIYHNVKLLELYKDKYDNFIEPLLGEEVMAIGTPILRTLKGSISIGVVSGIKRVPLKKSNDIFTQYHGIQTDAGINPGNSGGPLLNMDGKVIGVNTMKIQIEGSREVEGLCYALSIHDMDIYATKIMNTLSFFSTVIYNKRVCLSSNTKYISIKNLSIKERIKYGVLDHYKGVMLLSDDNELNIKAYSIIVSIDETSIDDVYDLKRKLNELNKNTKVKLGVYQKTAENLDTNISYLDVTTVEITL